MKGIAVELDSYRLANYSTQIECIVCDSGNTPDAEYCHNCFAPMVMAHQARTQKTPPVMFCALGPSGVGKTVYLGTLLDMLSRQPKEMQVLVRGAFSVSLQQNTLGALARCEFPSKTPNEPDRWNWVHCQLRKPKAKHPFDLVIPDISGEALFEEVEHPRSYRVIHALLQRCHGVMVLIDATKLQGGSLDEDYFTMKLLSHLGESGVSDESPWRNRPVALIFSKADQCESCFDDPAAYAQRHAPGVWRICRQRFHRCQFFAAGVAGACVTRAVPGSGMHSVPLRIEPRGILEPFEWLVNNLAK